MHVMELFNLFFPIWFNNVVAERGASGYEFFFRDPRHAFGTSRSSYPESAVNQGIRILMYHCIFKSAFNHVFGAGSIPRCSNQNLSATTYLNFILNEKVGVLTVESIHFKYKTSVFSDLNCNIILKQTIYSLKFKKIYHIVQVFCIFWSEWIATCIYFLALFGKLFRLSK